MAARSQIDQALDLGVAAGGIEVEVDPAAAGRAGLAGLEGEVGALPGGITEDDPAAFCRAAGDVVKSLLPECDDAIEFVAMNDNGPV